MSGAIAISVAAVSMTPPSAFQVQGASAPNGKTQTPLPEIAHELEQKTQYRATAATPDHERCQSCRQEFARQLFGRLFYDCPQGCGNYCLNDIQLHRRVVTCIACKKQHCQALSGQMCTGCAARLLRLRMGLPPEPAE